MSLKNVRAHIGHRSLAVAMLCLSVAILAACGKTVPTPEPVTIVFSHSEADADFYTPLAIEFSESHPYTTVELRPKSGDLMGNIDVGEADAFAVNAIALSQLQERGDVVNLDQFIDLDDTFDLSDYYPSTVELLSSQGKHWAIPSGVDMYVMYYSRDLFDQYNVPFPQIGWSWDTFLNAALAIRDPDAGTFGYATVPVPFDAALFVYQHGGRIVDDFRGPLKAALDDPLTIEAMEWYAKLFHDYDVAPTPQQARETFAGGQYAVYDGIRRGKVGMWIGAFSERGGLTWPVEWQVDWGMVSVPRDLQAATYGWVEAYAISAESPHPDACWAWIRFLSERTTYRLMPARRSLAESDLYKQQVGTEIAAVARASLEHSMLIPPRVMAQLAQTGTIFFEAVGRIVTGEASPREAMEQAQRRAESTNP